MVVGLAGLNQDRPEIQRESTANRPWIRCWARGLDDYLFFLLVIVPTWQLLRLLSGFSISSEVPGYVQAGAVGLWIFVEAYLLSKWGTTPGKAIFRITVRNQDDSKLSYKQALARAFQVWLRGCALGLPYLGLIAQVLSFRRLRAQGITDWDAEGQWNVETRPLSRSRILLIIFGVLILCLIEAILL